MASSSREDSVASGRIIRDPKELPSICHLGKGLSGFVYETKWEGHKYARKDFPLGSEMCNSVFETEAKLLFALDHPNIVKCIGYTVGDNSCSLVQEYVDGNLQNTIQSRIEARRKTSSSSSSSTSHLRIVDVDEVKRLLSSIEGSRKITKVDGGSSETRSGRERTSIIPFEVSEAVDIISQIAAGMKYLHDYGVIHGDLKPKNVLMSSENGATNLVKVADFGLHGTKKRIKLVSKRTLQFEILRWKAPELFQKLLGTLTDDLFTDSDTDEDVSSDHGIDEFNLLAMADVYSFGLTCSHILGGKLVNPNLSLTQLRDERTKYGFTPELPSAACPDYLRDLIHSCLDSTPSSRPTFSNVCAWLALYAATNDVTPQLHLNPRTKSIEQHDHDNPESSSFQDEMEVAGAKRCGGSTGAGGVFLTRNKKADIVETRPQKWWNESSKLWEGKKLHDGTRVLVDYKINKPTGARAYFHMLLDASGSMSHRLAGGVLRASHVYEELFECYEDLVTSGEALRQDDIICVWLFNYCTKLLCEVEVRNFHKMKDQIKKEYEKELYNRNRNETRLYDAVAHVMDTKIRTVWNENKKADFFLVAFTDGRDRGTGTTSLDAMMKKLIQHSGRLHTFFITVNLPTNAPLYLCLVQQNEMKLVHCESTQPSDIRRAFNTVRVLIKAVLVVLAKRPGHTEQLTRVVEFGETKEAIADQMMDTLSKQMRHTSLIELYNDFTKPRRLTN